jgi:hypothetical protein
VTNSAKREKNSEKEEFLTFQQRLQELQDEDDRPKKQQPSHPPQPRTPLKNSHPTEPINARDLRISSDRRKDNDDAANLQSSGGSKQKSHRGGPLNTSTGRQQGKPSQSPHHQHQQPQSRLPSHEAGPRSQANAKQPFSSSTPKTKNYSATKLGHGNSDFSNNKPNKTPSKYPPQQQRFDGNYVPRNNTKPNNNSTNPAQPKPPFKPDFQKKKEFSASSAGRFLVENHFRNKVSGYVFFLFDEIHIITPFSLFSGTRTSNRCASSTQARRRRTRPCC